MQTKAFRTKRTKNGWLRYQERHRESYQPVSHDNLHSELRDLANLHMMNEEGEQIVSNDNVEYKNENTTQYNTQDMWTNLEDITKPLLDETQAEHDLNLNVLYTEKQKLVQQVLDGQINKPYANDPVKVPEDDHVPDSDLPSLWQDSIKDLKLSDGAL